MTPPKEVVDELKAKHGRVWSVWLRDFGDVVFRRLSLDEFGIIFNSHLHTDEKEEKIVQSVVVWPDRFNVEDLPPAAVSMLQQKIFKVSNFASVEEANEILQEIKEEESRNIVSLVKAFIIAAIPTYKPEELGTKTFEEICRLIGLSENVFGIQARVMMEGGASLSLVSGVSEEEPPQSSGDPIADKLNAAMRQMNLG